MTSNSRSPSPADGTEQRSGTIVQFDQATESASTTVVTTVADLEGTDPTDIEPLYTVVDPDSLDGLVDSLGGSSSASGVEVTFRYLGYTVTVHSHGAVEVAIRTDD